MRYCSVVVLLAWTVGSADVLVADQRQSAGGLTGTKPRAQPLADIPKEFGFLFLSPDQLDRDAAKRSTYWEDLWKGLPYDSISLERGGTAGCPPGVCSTVTFYRATVSGIAMPAPCRTAPCPPGSGRAELSTVETLGGISPIAFLLPPQPVQPPAPIIKDFEGSVDIRSFANLSYLLHQLRFLDLPNEYHCFSCSPHRFYATLSVVAGGKTKTVIDYGEERPIELWAIQQAFDSVSKNVKWTQK